MRRWLWLAMLLMIGTAVGCGGTKSTTQDTGRQIPPRRIPEPGK